MTDPTVGEDERAMPDGGRALSVEERAARRDRLEAAPGDRWSHLFRALRSGREVPFDGEVRTRIEWTPVFRRSIIVVVAAVLLYSALRVGTDWIRQGRVDTWAGPDVNVQSGQQLAACPAAGNVTDDVFPSWIRIDSAVYTLTDAIRPTARDGSGGQTSYTESGYTDGSLHLLFDDTTPQGLQRDYVMVYAPPAIAARVYDAAPQCH